MKKIFLSLTLLFSTFMLVSTVRAAETVTGNLVIHFQKWDGDYSEVGVNSWDHNSTNINGTVGPTALSENENVDFDDFGIYFDFGEITVDPTGSIGFQVVGFDNVGLETESANWDRKLANHEIDASVIVEDETVHVYMFEGSNTRTNNEADSDGKIEYLVADYDKQGVIVVYYDSSGNYEENIGFHSWNWAEGGNAQDWNDPLKIFVDAGKSSSGVMLKAAILNYKEEYPDEGYPGAIVYFGDGDNSKKTDNLEPFNEENKAYIAEKAPKGKLDTIYTVNEGSGNTSNTNVWVNEPESFSEVAFSFEFMQFKPAAGITSASGTYALDKNTIVVQTNQQVPNIYVEAETEADKLAAEVTMTGWFTVREITSEEDATELTFGNEVKIDRVDFSKALANKTIADFVILLETELDNTKRYAISFDDNEARVHTMELDLDREKPVLIFLGSIAGKPEAERIINVEWNKKFNQNLFPTFQISDSRDGDLTNYAYVPKGDFSTLNTNVVGDYVIMLEVEDSWGNVTQEKFTFRVAK